VCALAFLDIDGDVAAALRSVLGAHTSTRAVGSSRSVNASF
jgi:hypothetical protein